MAYLFKFRGPVEPDREIDPGYVSELATALSAAGVYDPAKDPERKRNNGLTTGMQLGLREFQQRFGLPGTGTISTDDRTPEFLFWDQLMDDPSIYGNDELFGLPDNNPKVVQAKRNYQNRLTEMSKPGTISNRVGYGLENHPGDVQELSKLVAKSVDGYDPGEEERRGLYGAGLKAAIEAVQRHFGLSEDGIVTADGPTLKAMRQLAILTGDTPNNQSAVSPLREQTNPSRNMNSDRSMTSQYPQFGLPPHAESQSDGHRPGQLTPIEKLEALVQYVNDTPFSALQCPLRHPSPDDPAWKPYVGDPEIFHCGFRGLLENRVPTPDKPQAECFYDFDGRLVDENHEYAGCRGTANQYPATHPGHVFFDSGGVVKKGIPSALESFRYDLDRFLDDIFR